MQPVPPRRPRCPHCGTPQGPNNRAVIVTLGGAALLALIFLIWVMIRAFQEEDLMKDSPVPDAAVFLVVATGLPTSR